MAFESLFHKFVIVDNSESCSHTRHAHDIVCTTSAPRTIQLRVPLRNNARRRTMSALEVPWIYAVLGPASSGRLKCSVEQAECTPPASDDYSACLQAAARWPSLRDCDHPVKQLEVPRRTLITSTRSAVEIWVSERAREPRRFEPRPTTVGPTDRRFSN